MCKREGIRWAQIEAWRFTELGLTKTTLEHLILADRLLILADVRDVASIGTRTVAILRGVWIAGKDVALFCAVCWVSARFGIAIGNTIRTSQNGLGPV